MVYMHVNKQIVLRTYITLLVLVLDNNRLNCKHSIVTPKFGNKMDGMN